MFKIFIIIYSVLASVACLPNVYTEEAPDRPGYCRIEDVYIKKGEVGPAPIGECYKIQCNAIPGRLWTEYFSCDLFVPRKGCRLSEYDSTKPYPDCCPREVCPTE